MRSSGQKVVALVHLAEVRPGIICCFCKIQNALNYIKIFKFLVSAIRKINHRNFSPQFKVMTNFEECTTGQMVEITFDITKH